MNYQPKLKHGEDLSIELAQRRPVAVLAVGDPEEWVLHGNQPPSEGGLAFISFDTSSCVCVCHCFWKKTQKTCKLDP